MDYEAQAQLWLHWLSVEQVARAEIVKFSR